MKKKDSGRDDGRACLPTSGISAEHTGTYK